MEPQRINLWIQAATSIAVVLGIALVIWELQQNRNIAAAQLTSDIYAYLLQQNVALMGEEAADALAKACDEPANLTTKEKIILSEHYQGILNRIRRAADIESNSGINYLTEGKFQQVVESNFRLIFFLEYGRWWWASGIAYTLDKKVKAVGDSILAESPPSQCKQFFSGYDDWIRERYSIQQ